MLALAAEPVVAMMNRPELEKLIKITEKRMKAATKELDFLQVVQITASGSNGELVYLLRWR